MIINGKPFRPWGKIDSIFAPIESAEWAYIGCVSTEDRCSILATYFPKYGSFAEKLLFRITDKPSEHSPLIEDRTDFNQKIFESLYFSNNDICELNIFDAFGKFEQEVSKYIRNVTTHRLIIDISTLPKRVFFHIIRQIYRNANKFTDVVVVYSEPAGYSPKTLASNPEAWDALPGFRVGFRNRKGLKILVGTGFEPLGLPSLAEAGEFNNSSVSFILPFPADQENNIKNWQFIRDIFPNSDDPSFKVLRVDGTNVPEIYDLICGQGDSGNIDLLLAPYGPKPMSLAMALYAAKHEGSSGASTGVYYTQPTYYDPHYSIGVKLINGKPSINCYVIKKNSQYLY
jgi:hypothetical protein